MRKGVEVIQDYKRKKNGIKLIELFELENGVRREKIKKNG